MISSKILDIIENESQNKTKAKHWKERKENIQVGRRPAYMDKLTNKKTMQCHNKNKGLHNLSDEKL